jgi:hypothetical protein
MMADPESARLTQLRNIQVKTGKSIGELHAVIAKSGLEKVGQYRALLIEQCKLGYGDANTVALFYGKPMPHLDGLGAEELATPAGDPLSAIYVGAKAHLRPLHETVLGLIGKFGPFDVAPKKSYVSLRRKKQFAMVGPATKDLIAIGINARQLHTTTRLRAMPPGGMCQYEVRIGSAQDLDKELLDWVRTAYDSAG